MRAGGNAHGLPLARPALLLRQVTLSQARGNTDGVEHARYADAYQRSPEEVEPADDNKTHKHHHPDEQQEWGSKKKLIAGQCEVSVSQAEEDERHAMSGIEAHPTSPHRCFFGKDG
jgi:hypothetical protein